MTKRLVFNAGHLKAWLMPTLEGRVLKIQHMPGKIDPADLKVFANNLIPRGWKRSTERPTREADGELVVPLRRATRGVGR